MRTDPRQLNGRTFDLVVVGGGIQGAAIAREAALRQIPTLLIEAHDFATGTSSRSSRLVHGGLRYLQQGHIALVKEALRERERLLRLCPHLVRPVPMLMPFFRDGGGSRWLSWLGVRAYSWLAGDSTMPAPKKLSPVAAAAAFPGLRTEGLLGAVQFFDAATNDARITMANVLAAARAGAAVANHCELVGPAPGGGLLLRDHVAGVDVVVQARHVLNAAGPRADAVRRRLRLDGDDLVRCSRGSHLVLDPRPGETALAAFLPDGRIQFVVPHTDGTICGTTDVDEAPTDSEPTVPEDDVRYLLAALGTLMAPPPRRQDVRFAYCGWRSLPARKGPPGGLNREAFLVTESIGDGTALHTAVGGKLTTHRAFAERSLHHVFDLAPAESPTRALALPGGDGPREVQDPLWWRHGSLVLEVREIARQRPEWNAPLCPHRPHLRAEAVHALRHLGVVTFADLMLRRLIHSHGPCLERDCLRAAHALFAQERAWRLDDDFDAAAAELEQQVRLLNGAIREQRRPAEV